MCGESQDRGRAVRIVRFSDRERSKRNENDGRDDERSRRPVQTRAQHAHCFEVERVFVLREHGVRTPPFLIVRALARIVV